MKLTLITFFCLLGWHLMAQDSRAEYTVNYDFKWITDTTELTYSKPEQYLLYKLGEESRFVNSNSYHRDSILNNYTKGKDERVYSPESVALFFETEAKKLKQFTSDLRVSKNFRKKESTIILYNTSRRSYLIEPLRLKWEMMNGIDTVAGIPCYKAKTNHGGRDYIAWYTPQVPISDGPYIFYGLPGLITKVVDTNNWYFFEMKAFQVKPKRSMLNLPFIEKTYPQAINRKNYVARTRKEKYDPRYRMYYKKITPEVIASLRERRKTRFDLIMECK